MVAQKPQLYLGAGTGLVTFKNQVLSQVPRYERQPFQQPDSSSLISHICSGGVYILSVDAGSLSSQQIKASTCRAQFICCGLNEEKQYEEVPGFHHRFAKKAKQLETWALFTPAFGQTTPSYSA